jgi:hypothetical protein
MNRPGPEEGAAAQDEETAAKARTRRGFLGALLATLASGLVAVLLWLLSRNAPSAGRDPAWADPVRLPTRTPAPTTSPEPVMPSAPTNP